MANPSRLKVAVGMIHITQQQRPLKGLNYYPLIIAIHGLGKRWEALREILPKCEFPTQKMN